MSLNTQNQESREKGPGDAPPPQLTLRAKFFPKTRRFLSPQLPVLNCKAHIAAGMIILGSFFSALLLLHRV